MSLHDITWRNHLRGRASFKFIKSWSRDTVHRLLLLNVQKTKYMSVKRCTVEPSFKTMNGSDLEMVEYFKYLGSYSQTLTEINTRMAQAWSALHSLEKYWKSSISTKNKLKFYDAKVKSIFLYAYKSWSINKSLERKIDGCYTRMLRRVKNINPQSHTSNRVLYNGRHPISHVVTQCRLRLAV